MTATYDDLMRFVTDLLVYYDETGIQDKLDTQSNRMVTSTGVYELIQRARKLTPERLKGGVAAKRMEQLPEDEREKAVTASDNVIDLRAEFARKISKNGGTRNLIAELVDAQKAGDLDRAAEIFEIMETFTNAERGEETFEENK